MAQGLGFIEFSTGDVLSAAAANGYLASQTVMVFASSAARTSAITTPYEGMMSYLKDSNSVEYYSGSAWVAVGGASGGMTLLSTTTLSSTSTTISGISGSYKNLQIAIFGVNHSTSGQNITLQFNSVTSGYFGTTTDDSSTAATRTSNASAIPVLFGNGYGTGGENLTNINIPFYSKASVRKPIEIQTVYKTDDPTTRLTGATNGVYGSANTSAISSITILSSATPTAGTVEIYGIN